jgi:hypothetical protein
MLLEIAALGSTLFNSLRQKRETDQQRRNIDAALVDANLQRGSLARENRNAWSNAMSFMAANRGDPNAWRFASESYNNTLQANTAQDNRLLGMIAQLKLERPKRVSGMDVIAQTGMGALQGLMLGKVLKSTGMDTGLKIPWWKRKAPVVNDLPTQSTGNFQFPTWSA